MEYEYKGIFVKFFPSFCSFLRTTEVVLVFTYSRTDLAAKLAEDLGCPYDIAEGAVNHHYGR